MPIDRKIWKGDVLNLAEGNSFWCDEVVRHRAGSASVMKDSEVGDPLVEISGGYFVKRTDLSELSQREAKVLGLAAKLALAGLNGLTAKERADIESQLEDELQCR